MKEMQWLFVDKSTWGEGPWQNEPDKLQWVDQATGLPCMIHRSVGSGALCGYVGLDDKHPLYGIDYNQTPYFEVHGGLTFSAFCAETKENGSGICHLPEPGEPDHVWWFGFDCAHSGDYQPTRAYFSCASSERYSNLAYVKGECASLAQQLRETGMLDKSHILKMVQNDSE